MDYLYFIIVVLLALGIVDLVVGVSNDAVNFLNSAIGSNVAKRHYIYIVAGAGLLLGAGFSGDMMEVARKGIFYPENFYLNQLLVVFLAVMITDIILIDLFNTFGFPTSTTIAIVFELLGGALAMGLIIISGENPDGLVITDLINTQRVLVILAGITISIILAFATGSLVQFVARNIFTFRYRGRFKIMFSLAGAIALTSIVFLLLKKDIAFANYLTGYIDLLVHESLALVLLVFFAIAFTLFTLLAYVFNADIPKIVVFCGTFALALSFAANDLVNFIGVPLSAFEGVNVFKQSGLSNPSMLLMNIWQGGVLNNTLWESSSYRLIYFASGLIMVITLFYSKKARTVTNTELYLGKQDAGQEEFEPSQLSRTLVKSFLSLYNYTRRNMPVKWVDFFSNRYERNIEDAEQDSDAAVVYFDTVRASVNLVVASILITIGTYLHFPLSTTFVVFMVAMGTSLADQAWGRESAVYRISGVLSVLGGWFITASAGFVGAFIITVFIWWGNIYAIIPLLIAVCIVIYRTNTIHKKARLQRIELKDERTKQIASDIDNLLDAGNERIRKHILETSKIYILIIQGFVEDDEKQVKETCEKSKYLQKVSKSIKRDLFNSFSSMDTETFDSGHYFIQAIDYLGELSNTLIQIAEPIYNHIENQHKGLSDTQKEDVLLLLEEIMSFFNFLVHIEKEKRFSSVPEMVEKQKYIVALIEDLRTKQIKRIMDGDGKTRSSILLLECYAESKNLIHYTLNLLKSHRDFHTNTISR
ncbi:inorganic phosphate transporter [Labilibacter marinus]|uniref:inorganic phosphate transporter n=1 Tax=Labilibacter marinus TaxID=1477105 RepID=UPI00094FA1CA|nr:inorganic phosphate transporter [Labilibacter marinus]